MTIALVALAVALVAATIVASRARAVAAAFVAKGAALANEADAVRAAGQRLVAAFDAVSEGVVVLDERRCVIAQNAAARELLGLGADAIGRPVADVLPWPALARAIELRHDPEATKSFELDGIETGGRVLAVRVLAGAHASIVIGIDDQSRLRRLESLRRDFVGNVSHELKTPLAAIQGFVETLQDDPAMPVATRERFLERIAMQTARLATLVSDLLTLSRLDDDGGVHDAEPSDFAAVVRETVRDLHLLAERRGVHLAIAGADAPIHVAADEEALRQIASNLIDNAIKYTPAAGNVRVSLRRDGSRVRLEVEDTGIGLTPEDQERVFERFYRVDRARSRELGGTGLGLSIVKNTVKRLGGEVGVTSQLGKGSSFRVDLPILGANEPASATG